jgi:uncharacterized iron-regulated membrane protein
MNRITLWFVAILAVWGMFVYFAPEISAWINSIWRLW